MMKRFMSALIVLLCSIVGVCAQQQGKTVLRFDTTTWNFGNIQEVEGKVSHTFHFTNIHTSPAISKSIMPMKLWRILSRKYRQGRPLYMD